MRRRALDRLSGVVILPGNLSPDAGRQDRAVWRVQHDARESAVNVLLANPRCYCAGVDRAVQIVELALERFRPPVYVRKEIVHNRFVVNRLRDKGAVFVEELSEVPPGSLAVFSAHGVAPSVFAEAEERSLRVREGYHIILIGRGGHEEVEGTLGHSAENITLIENVEQARKKPVPEHAKLMVLTQTTLSVDDTQMVVAALGERFNDLESPAAEDICYATQNRQNAVKEMCGRGIDLLLVVGSPNSSNAARLVEAGQVRGVPGRLIDNETELRPEWLAGVELVGVTGGASTPDEVVQAVVQRLRALGAGDVELCTTAKENTVFQLPMTLRETGKVSFAD